MLFDIVSQLNALTETLQLVSNVASTVEPGQKVELQVLSGAPNLLVTDNVLDIPFIGTLTGTLAGALKGTAQALTQIPVEIHVEWSIKDTTDPREPKKLELGTDYLAANGLKGPSVAFLFKPAFVELGSVETPVPTDLHIEASVKLRAWLTDQRLVGTPPVPVTKPIMVESRPVILPLDLKLVPLEIPTMLSLFRFDDFRSLGQDDLEAGFVLMVVPNNSPLQDLTTLMNDTLERIEKAIQPIRSLVGLAVFLARLNILRQALSAQPMVRLRHGNINNLTKIHMRVETLFGIDQLNRDLRPNDRISSLIFMGTEGRKVACFNDEKHKLGEGAFAVSTGLEMITLIRSLRVSIADLAAIPGVEILKKDPDGSFEDSMSSIQFKS